MTAGAVGSLRDSGLWAITAYWNPMGYRRRRENFRIFRERLGVPLVAVELRNGTGFDLLVGDAEILIQTAGQDMLWQKERLLNVALASLPANCDVVAWIDADVVFQTPDWPERTIAALARHSLVQLFREVHLMPAGWTPGCVPPAAEVRQSVPSLIAGGMPVEVCLGTPAQQLGCAFGYAWAAQRAVVERHGFYDACVIGGGDSALARAAYGQVEAGGRLHLMHGARADHYRAWAEAFYGTIGGSVGFVEGALHHLWHGSPKNRRYRQRLEDFARFDFDPAADIVVDAGGAWRWSSGKPEMHAYVREYFASRQEDG